MIVKDEARIINRCLDSVRDLIDYWVICDTGSTDGTQELVRNALVTVPGELHNRPWVNFGHNRSEVLELAQGKADYLLLLDADMTVSYNDDLGDLDADDYMLRVPGDPDYRLRCLINGKIRWFSVGATHEYTSTNEPVHTEELDSIIIHHHCDGSRRGDKFVNDLQLLSEAHKNDPTNPRTKFYLANTLRDLGQSQIAAMYYRERATMGGWDQEVFYAMYEAGRLVEDPMMLFEAWNYRPQRVEPLYQIIRMLREKAQYEAAYLILPNAMRIPIPNDILFVHRWIYEWGLLFEFSIITYWLGQREAALGACDLLLEMPMLPEVTRKQVETNRTYCLPVVTP
jgi:glycosyltransferase involved in cell wall biosynthesis